MPNKHACQKQLQRIKNNNSNVKTEHTQSYSKAQAQQRNLFKRTKALTKINTFV